MAKDFEMGYLLDFYGEVLTPKQREMLNQYYNDDLSLSEIGENFGITRQGARDAIKHGETTLKELEAKVGFAGRYRRVQEKLEELEQLVIDARFECTGPYARLTTTEYAATLNKMLRLIRSIDEVNVQVIMERMGGGGHLNIAGCQLENTSVEEGIIVLKRTLDKMIEEGEIS